MSRLCTQVTNVVLVLLISSCISVQSFGFPKAPLERPRSWDDIKHVVIIVFENTSPIEAIKQPFLRSLVTQGAHLSDYYAITHPSQPNYIAMVSGNTFNVKGDKNYDLLGYSIADLLENKGLTWKVYAEDFPGNCFLKDKEGLYVRKHVPFLSFINIQTSPTRCSNIVPATQFAVDRTNNQLPTYSMYIPNLENDGHNTGVKFADRWFEQTFSGYFSDQDLLKDTLFIITFDEDDWFHGNRIYTVFLGAGVQPGITSSTRYNHYSMLRTIEEIFSLGSLHQYDLFADIISDIWR